MRQVFPQASTFPLYLHDGFDLQRFSTYVSARHDFVVQDHHSYFVFTTEDDEESASNHTSDIEGGLADSLRAASDAQRRNLVVDEFSCALSDDSLKNETDPEQARRDFCTGQLDVYANTTAGWSFWGMDCALSTFLTVSQSLFVQRTARSNVKRTLAGASQTPLDDIFRRHSFHTAPDLHLSRFKFLASLRFYKESLRLPQILHPHLCLRQSTPAALPPYRLHLVVASGVECILGRSIVAEDFEDKTPPIVPDNSARRTRDTAMVTIPHGYLVLTGRSLGSSDSMSRTA